MFSLNVTTWNANGRLLPERELPRPPDVRRHERVNFRGVGVSQFVGSGDRVPAGLIYSVVAPAGVRPS